MILPAVLDRIFVKAAVSKLPARMKLIALVLATILLALAASEIVVRIFGIDWKYYSNDLYYQRVDLENHQPDPDPRILYRLRPGQYTYSVNEVSYSVGVNSLGARGPERSRDKTPGVFRIVVVGGSNVYGAAVSDDETWPARLEAAVNRDETGRYEVWNFGTSAYVPVQMSAVAAEAVEKLDPDLLIYALSNWGARGFLWGAPVKPYFDKNPSLWAGFFSPDCLKFPPLLSGGAKLSLASESALYRLFIALHASPSCLSWTANDEHEQWNVAAFREFVERYRGRVKICVFRYPGPGPSKIHMAEFTEGLGLPIFELRAEGMPAEYGLVHPLPHVLNWYGERIAAWLRDGALIPTPAGP